MEYPVLLLIGIVAMLVSDVLLFLLGYSLHRRNRLDNPLKDASAADERDQNTAIRESLLALSEHLVQVEENLKKLDARQQEIELKERGQQPYGVAIKLVQSGADIGELMSICGLTRGEAELIVTLHEMNRDSEAKAS